MKMRSTVSQFTTCGLTEADLTKLANTILRFLVATIYKRNNREGKVRLHSDLKAVQYEVQRNIKKASPCSRLHNEILLDIPLQRSL